MICATVYSAATASERHRSVVARSVDGDANERSPAAQRDRQLAQIRQSRETTMFTFSLLYVRTS